MFAVIFCEEVVSCECVMLQLNSLQGKTSDVARILIECICKQCKVSV